MFLTSELWNKTVMLSHLERSAMSFLFQVEVCIYSSTCSDKHKANNWLQMLYLKCSISNSWDTCCKLAVGTHDCHMTLTDLTLEGWCAEERQLMWSNSPVSMSSHQNVHYAPSQAAFSWWHSTGRWNCQQKIQRLHRMVELLMQNTPQGDGTINTRQRRSTGWQNCQHKTQTLHRVTELSTQNTDTPQGDRIVNTRHWHSTGWQNCQHKTQTLHMVIELSTQDTDTPHGDRIVNTRHRHSTGQWNWQ